MKRNLFNELLRGLKALRSERKGKSTLKSHSADKSFDFSSNQKLSKDFPDDIEEVPQQTREDL